MSDRKVFGFVEGFPHLLILLGERANLVDDTACHEETAGAPKELHYVLLATVQVLQTGDGVQKIPI